MKPFSQLISEGIIEEEITRVRALAHLNHIPRRNGKNKLFRVGPSRKHYEVWYNGHYKAFMVTAPHGVAIKPQQFKTAEEVYDFMVTNDGPLYSVEDLG